MFRVSDSFWIYFLTEHIDGSSIPARCGLDAFPRLFLSPFPRRPGSHPLMMLCIVNDSIVHGSLLVKGCHQYRPVRSLHQDRLPQSNHVHRSAQDLLDHLESDLQRVRWRHLISEGTSNATPLWDIPP